MKLFLDDDAKTKGLESFRYPSDDSFTIAVSLEEAILLTKENGCPTFIDFDHDLGVDSNGVVKTSMDYLYWLVYEFLPEDNTFVPEYKIHSKNFKGTENILSFMESWKQSLQR